MNSAVSYILTSLGLRPIRSQLSYSDHEDYFELEIAKRLCTGANVGVSIKESTSDSLLTKAANAIKGWNKKYLKKLVKNF